MVRLQLTKVTAIIDDQTLMVAILCDGRNPGSLTVIFLHVNEYDIFILVKLDQSKWKNNAQD